jgi:Fe-S cluster assembly protein SufD
MLAGVVRLNKSPDDWLNRLRGTALEAAHSLTLPGRSEEDWRFTDLSSLYALAFSTLPAPLRTPPESLDRFAVQEAGARLVFVDGLFDPALSITAQGKGLLAADLRESLALAAPRVQRVLGTLCTFKDNAFTAINTAYLQEAAVVMLERNAAPASSVHILFLSTRPEAAFHPRVLVAVEQGADLTLIEEHAALHDGVYCANAVTEIAVGMNARVRHVRLQRESERAYHIGSCAVQLARDSTYESHAVTTGALISRYGLTVKLAEAARVSAGGLAVLGGRQLGDTHSFFEHAAPQGLSRQKHKTILDGASRAVFNGRILVCPGAQGTDSSQQSRNLLLSDRARIDTKPQLEIFADDVKCSHGATVGQLEAEELFYLRSRGMSLSQARTLLTRGFAAEIIDGIPVASLVRRLHESVTARIGAKDGS